MSANQRILLAGVVGAVVASVIVLDLLVAALAQDRVEGRPYDRSLIGSEDPFDIVVSWSDAQATVALSRDPLLLHPERSGIDASNLAYRAQRPVLPALVWALSAGGAIPEGAVLMVIVALSGGAAAIGAAVLLHGGALSSLGGVAVVLLPGSLASVHGLGPELIGIGAAAAGIIAYGRGRSGVASALFAFLVLVRETFILVPIGLAAAIVRDDRRGAASMLAAPAVAMGVWFVFIRWQMGSWSFEGAPETLAAPFVGLRSLPEQGIVADGAVLALTIALVVLALQGHRREPALAAVVIAHVPLIALFGPDVWRNWYDFARPMLPMTAMAVVMILRERQVATSMKDGPT